MRADRFAKIALLSLVPLTGCTVHHHYPAARAAPAVDEVGDGSECAPLLPAPDALAGADPTNVPTHSHSPAAAPEGPPSSDAVKDGPRVIAHAELEKFENQGSVLIGLATARLGAKNFEIWRSSVPPGGATPLHVHDTEEIFVLLQGKGKLLVGDRAVEFEAPATVIAPAHVPHQLVNTGDVPTDQIVVVGIGSEIKNEQGKLMELPWRK